MTRVSTFSSVEDRISKMEAGLVLTGNTAGSQLLQKKAAVVWMDRTHAE